MNEAHYHRPDFNGGKSNSETEAQENLAAKIIEARWPGVHAYRFTRFSPVDWYFTDDQYEHLYAVAEIKCRNHDMQRYETAFLAVNKHRRLIDTAAALDLLPLFFWRFTDGHLCWVDCREVDASKVKVGGMIRIEYSRGNREPVIEVPINQLKEV